MHLKWCIIIFRRCEAQKSFAGYCSGGELQMLVIGRALMAHPQLLMLDELSLGLRTAGRLEIFRIIKKINEEHGTTIVLVEQNASGPCRSPIMAIDGKR